VGWLGYDPELAFGMVNEGDGMPSGGTDRPATTEEVDLVVGVDTSAEVDGEMEIQEAGVGTRTQNGALFGLGLSAGVAWGYFLSGVEYPDVTVIGPEMLKQGSSFVGDAVVYGSPGGNKARLAVCNVHQHIAFSRHRRIHHRAGSRLTMKVCASCSGMPILSQLETSRGLILYWLGTANALIDNIASPRLSCSCRQSSSPSLRDWTSGRSMPPPGWCSIAACTRGNWSAIAGSNWTRPGSGSVPAGSLPAGPQGR